MAYPPLLLGHRGTRALRSTPENTFAAFDAALVRGCDGFEFDVRRTGDGRAVVVHNEKVHGISVAKAKRGELNNLPRLQQVMRKYGSRGFLDIELKVEGLEAMLLAALREHPPIRGYVVSSFLPEVVLELRARRSAIPLGIICSKPAQLRRGRQLPVDYVIVEESLVREKLVGEIHRAGKKLLVWTVNNPASMGRLAKWGADGIVSDDPELLVRTLSMPRPPGPQREAIKRPSEAEKAKSRKRARG
jgi:glycerophosphoryl diester phosphodiesterase